MAASPERLTSNYARLLRNPKLARLIVAFLALGIANTMAPVAFVLFAHAATGSYASASLVLAAATAGSLVFGPLRGRLVDRIGARRAVLALALPDVVADFVFIAAGRQHVATAALVAIAFIADAITAPASTALRAVWSRTLGESDRQTGYALMSMLQETTYIAGPLVAGLLVAAGTPTLAVAGAAVLSFVGAVLFALPQPGTSPAPAPSGKSQRLPALRGAGIRTVVTTAAAFGLTFGILDVAFPAYARTYGSAATSGILLSAFAVGSWIGSFAYGLRPRVRTAGERYPVLCLAAAAGLAPLIFAPPLAGMVGLAGLAGILFAPISTSQIAVIDEVADPANKGEAFSWLGTLYGAGSAAGAALAGQLIAVADTRAALAAACAATAAAWIFVLFRASTLRSPQGLATKPAPDG